jgi:sugar lactone lactonase YvrE
MKKITTFILTVLLLSNVIYSQTVSTYTDGTPDDAMAIDSNGNLYASNFTGDTVFKYDMDGNGTSFITGLNTPNGLAFDSNDNLFICDFSGQSIYKYDSNGILLETIPGIVNPSGMIKSFNSDAMIFTNYTTNSIHKLAIDGVISLISNDPQLNGPVGLAFDENGVLYAGNYNDRKIYKILNDGTAIYIAQLPTDGGALPNLGFITYAQGRIWGTTMGSDKIYSINPNGIDDYVLFAGEIAGSLDGDISIATFTTPNGIIFNDSEDIMYITDFGTKNVRKISGVILSVNDQNLKDKKFIMFPNPARDMLTIKPINFQGNEYSLHIYDNNGRLIYFSEYERENAVISTQNWAKGIYIAKIISKNFTSTKSIIK